MDSFFLILFATGLMLLSYMGVKAIIRPLSERDKVREAEPDSLHEQDVPSGAAVILVPLVLAAFAVLAVFFADGEFVRRTGWFQISALCAVPLALAAIGWRTEGKGERPLPAADRFCLDLLALLALLLTFGGGVRFVPGISLPLLPDRLAALAAGLFFLNAFRKMEVFDGFRALASASVCVGILVFSLISPLVSDELGYFAVAPGFVMLGFYLFNQYPAKVLLGRSGASAVAFLLFWLLLKVSEAGLGGAALTLLLYYFFETGWTAARRFAAAKFPDRGINTDYAFKRGILRGYPPGIVLKFVVKRSYVFVLLALMASLVPKYQAPLLLLGCLFAMQMLTMLPKLGERKPTLRGTWKEMMAMSRDVFSELKKSGETAMDGLNRKPSEDGKKPENQNKKKK